MSVGLIVALGIVTLVLAVWAIADAARRPVVAWHRIQKGKTTWITLIVVFTLALGVIGLVLAAYYLVVVRRQLVVAAATPTVRVVEDRVPAAGPVDVVRTVGLTKHFPLKRSARHEGDGPVIRAVDGVDLAIPPGSTLGLVGESGSGKSTVARLVLRLVPVTSGQVFFEGEDITAIGPRELRERRHGMQLVFQDPYSSFDPQATVVDSVVEPLRAQGVKGAAAEKRAAELFDLVGLSPLYLHRYPRELSGGQLQRAGIARALATNPRLVVMDEPVSALDVSTQAQVINLLEDLQDELGIAFLFIAHDLAVVRHVSDRIAVMYLGQIVEEGPAAALYDGPTHPYTHALLSAIPVPNPRVQRSRFRVVLEGEIPSPADPPSGCRFRTRCPYAMDVCAEVEPPPFTGPNEVLARCHLHTTGPRLAGAPVATLAGAASGVGAGGADGRASGRAGSSLR